MKLKTHIVTALLVAYLIDVLISSLYPGYVSRYMLRIALYVFSAGVQYVIDHYGHTWKRWGGRVYPARNRLHSLPFLVLVGVLIGLVFTVLTHIWIFVLLTPLITVVHWVEDAMTEAGVYLGNRRVRLPIRIRYDSPLANRVTVLAFVPILMLTPRDPFSLAVYISLWILVASALVSP